LVLKIFCEDNQVKANAVWMREMRNRHRILAGSSEVSRPPGIRSHIYYWNCSWRNGGRGRVVVVVVWWWWCRWWCGIRKCSTLVVTLMKCQVLSEAGDFLIRWATPSFPRRTVKLKLRTSYSVFTKFSYISFEMFYLNKFGRYKCHKRVRTFWGSPTDKFNVICLKYNLYSPKDWMFWNVAWSVLYIARHLVFRRQVKSADTWSILKQSAEGICLVPQEELRRSGTLRKIT